MSKNLLQDMVRKKSIKKKESFTNFQPKNNEIKEIKIEGGGKSAYKIWFVALISGGFFLFALSFLFSKAEVKINPKTQEIVLNANLSAIKDTNTDGALPFDLVVISGEEQKIVQASEQKEIAQKAQGKVVIYNAFSSSSQILSIDTRLEGSNGKIYKTQTKVVVPGKQKDGTPGSVKVDIYGLEAGEEYNSAPLDFKIAGFKGTSKYAGFYARSEGDIKGGQKGQFFVLSESQKTGMINELKAALTAKLLKKATDLTPSGFILFKDAVFLDLKQDNVEFTSKDGNLPVKLEGTLYGLLFNESNLTERIAKDNIDNYDGSEIYIKNLPDLTFSISSQDSTSFADVKNIDFNLSGAAVIIWKFDADKLAKELLGKSKKDFNQILAQYPNIDSANLSLSPFWRRSIPEKIKDIKIIVNNPYQK